MLVFKLIEESKHEIDNLNIDFHHAIGFGEGGKWMSERMNHEDNISLNRYQKAGIYKYGLSSISICVSWLLFQELNLSFVISSIFIFYLIEVHFLFIFPLIIEDRSPILSNSVRLTYRIGIITSALNTMVIGLYMIAGLFNYKRPFYNWYVGCNCIIIWYEKVRYWI